MQQYKQANSYLVYTAYGLSEDCAGRIKVKRLFTEARD
jgi:hypothetical protein